MQSSFRLLEFNPDQSPLLYAHVHWHLGAHMLAEAEAGAGSGRVRPVWSQVGEERATTTGASSASGAWGNLVACS